MENTVIVVEQAPEKLVEEDQQVSPFTPEPMVIKISPIIERHFEDYKNGQERRRERRAKKRRHF